MLSCAASVASFVPLCWTQTNVVFSFCRLTLEGVKKYAHMFTCLWHMDHALHDLVLSRGAGFKGLSEKGESAAMWIEQEP